MLTRRGKLQTYGTPVPTTIPESFNIDNMNNRDGMKQYLSYVDILDVFQNEIFLSSDPDIDRYRNI